MTTSPWIATIAFIPQFLLAIHHIDFYGDMVQRVFESGDALRIVSGFVGVGMESVAYVICAILSLLSVLAFIWNHCDEE